MNWYYSEGGKQEGPVDEAQLAQMSAEGKIQEETLVWHEGMDHWKPFRDVEFTAPPPLPPGPPPPPVFTDPGVAPTDAICVECRNVFSRENMIHVGNSWVCAACKPVFTQKLAEGVPNLSGGVSDNARALTEAELLARDYQVDINGRLAKGRETFKANPGILIAGLVLGCGVPYGLSYLDIHLLQIPYLNVIVGLFLTGPLDAGLWLLYIKSSRGKSGGVTDVLAGFGHYVETFLAALFPSLLRYLTIFLFGLFLALDHSREATRNLPFLHPHLPPAAAAPLELLLVGAYLLQIYFGICWLFALPLVIDKGLLFWPALQLSRAMVMKHWWATFGLLIVIGFLALVGALACGVGMLVTAPIAFAALVAHYEKVFGDLAPQHQAA